MVSGRHDSVPCTDKDMGLGWGVRVKFVMVEEEAVALVIRMEPQRIVELANITCPHKFGKSGPEENVRGGEEDVFALGQVHVKASHGWIHN